MGFFWFKPENTLKEPLLPTGPAIVLNIGDIILIPSSDLEIVLNNDRWKDVAIALSPSLIWYNNKSIPTNVLLHSYEEICIRQLNCTRPPGFNQKFEKAIRTSKNVADTLLRMGFIDDGENRTPQHFSSNSPYTRIQLPMYSKNIFL
tara:strand:- start:133 stop:573 length:441 start_codon:yes stop_codon:yes gene_type:complete